MNTNQTIGRIASHFLFDGTLSGVRELKSGNVNRTYRLDMGEEPDAPSYILQRINTAAFHDPVALMENIRFVTTHMQEKFRSEGINPDRRVLSFVRSDAGGDSLLFEVPEGQDGAGFWRAYRYIGDVTAYDQIENAGLFREAGRGFGEFQRQLATFPADQLVETIPHFHDTPRRFEDLMEAVREDRAGRASEVTAELDFFRERQTKIREITERLSDGTLPLRVTHNDTKLNNVLFDNETGKALCVIDLDTVMPGSVLYDYGDAIRYGACTSPEDEPDLSKVDLDMTLVRAFTDGFLEMTADRLTDTELRLLPLGAETITCELAMRFLTDYLNGDTYFKIHYAGHNLVRTHAQMRLLEVMEEKHDDMCRCVHVAANR